MARALERFYVVDQSEGVARLSEVVTVRNGDATESTSKRIAQPTEEQDRLVEAARSIKARFIVVETASRLVEDEDNAAFSGLQSALGRIGRETGAAVTVTHHATKAASKENDSGIESARGGGALVYNARNALALFPAEPDAAKDYADRFPAEDVFVLTHGKPTSSTRRQAPIVLVRCDAVHGAVFRRPDEVVFTPEQATANAAKLEREREREIEQLRRLYDAVAKALPTRPGPSPSWIRDNLRSAVGVTEQRLEWLVGRAVAGGILQVVSRTDRGVRLGLGVDPSRPIDDSARVCPSREEDEP
jgi:RecA-family ATPase